MPQAIGKTYGFGRVSPETRPSPYTPVHLSSVAPDIVPAGDVVPNPVRARRRRRLALVLTIAVVVAASALAAAGFVRSTSRTTAERAPGATPDRAGQRGGAPRALRVRRGAPGRRTLVASRTPAAALPANCAECDSRRRS